MKNWFNGLSKLVQVILLILPLVGWIVEVVLRIEAALTAKKDEQLVKILVAVAFFVFGWTWVWQLIDVIWVLLYGHITFAK